MLKTEPTLTHRPYAPQKLILRPHPLPSKHLLLLRFMSTCWKHKERTRRKSFMYYRCAMKKPRKKFLSCLLPLTRIFEPRSHLNVAFLYHFPYTCSLCQWKNPIFPCQATCWKTNCQNHCPCRFQCHWKLHWPWTPIPCQLPPQETPSTNLCFQCGWYCYLTWDDPLESTYLHGSTSWFWRLISYDC